jgi:hypothetical protein
VLADAFQISFGAKDTIDRMPISITAKYVVMTYPKRLMA